MFFPRNFNFPIRKQKLVGSSGLPSEKPVPSRGSPGGRQPARPAPGSRSNRLVRSQADRSRSNQVSGARGKVQPDVNCSPRASSPMGNAQLWSFCPCLGTQKQADHRGFFIKSCLLAEGIAAVSATLPPLAACTFRLLLSHKQLQVPTSSKGLPPDAPARTDALPFADPHSRSGNDCKPSVHSYSNKPQREKAPGTPNCTKASSGCQLLTRLYLPERASNTTSRSQNTDFIDTLHRTEDNSLHIGWQMDS